MTGAPWECALAAVAALSRLLALLACMHTTLVPPTVQAPTLILLFGSKQVARLDMERRWTGCLTCIIAQHAYF